MNVEQPDSCEELPVVGGPLHGQSRAPAILFPWAPELKAVAFRVHIDGEPHDYQREGRQWTYKGANLLVEPNPRKRSARKKQRKQKCRK